MGRASRRWSRSSPAPSRPSSGEIRLEGQRDPDRRARVGATLRDRDGLSGDQPRADADASHKTCIWATRSSINRLRGTIIDAQQFLQSLNFPVDPTALVHSLGTAQRQMVEIARAVRLKAKIIIFDEPTATLTPEEKHYLFALMDRLRNDKVSIIFISHALEEALGTCGSHHHSQRRSAYHHRRSQDLHARDDHPSYGWPHTHRSTLWSGRRRPQGSPARRESPQRAEPLDAKRRAQHVLLDLCRTGDRDVRARRLGPHGNGQNCRGRRQARLLPWRRNTFWRAVGALPQPASGGRRRHRVRHRGSQGRRILRDHVGRRKHLHRTRSRARHSRGDRRAYERGARACRELDQATQHQGAQLRCAGH